MIHAIPKWNIVVMTMKICACTVAAIGKETFMEFDWPLKFNCYVCWGKKENYPKLHHLASGEGKRGMKTTSTTKGTMKEEIHNLNYYYYYYYK